MFFRNSLARFILNGFSVFVCLINSFSISEELLASEKNFEQFFSISLIMCIRVSTPPQKPLPKPPLKYAN